MSGDSGEVLSLDLPPLPDGWQWAALEELLDDRGISYGIVQPGSNDPNGVPIVRVSSIRHGQLDECEPLRVAPEVEQPYGRTRLAGGEVLLSLVGSVGQVAVVPTEYAGWNVARAIGVLRPLSEEKARWLKFCLEGPLAQRYMHVWKTTTVQETLNLRDVRRLPIVLPPQSERRAITEVLGAVDDKIEANRRLQASVERLARTRVEQAQLESHSVSPLGAIVERVSEIVQPNELPHDKTYVGLEHMPQGSLLLKERGRPIGLASAKAAFQARDVLFGKLRPYFKKVAVAPEAGVCSTDILVLRATGGDWAVAAAVCASDEVIDHATAGSEGTKMPRVSWDYLARFEVRLPTLDKRRLLHDEVAPLLELGLSLTTECDRLSVLRDALLPTLLSGELRVRDAEALVG